MRDAGLVPALVALTWVQHVGVVKAACLALINAVDK
jgi:hypothetical protein